MYLLRIDFSTPDIIILASMAVVLGFVVQFVLTSRRKLQAMIEESKRQASFAGTGARPADDILKPKWAEKKKLFPSNSDAPFAARKTYKAAVPAEAAVQPDVVEELRQSIRQQQKVMTQLLARVDKLDVPDAPELAQSAAALVLEEREAELQKVKQQLSATQKVAGRVTEVYQEFDVLQQKMAELEETAGKATELTLELEDMQQAYAQLEKEATRNQERLLQLTAENEELQQQLSETEEGFTEMNLQRQQLLKRVQLLENINAELHHMSEANTKMKTELRRIAELESMLSLVSDERDLLLKKRLS